MIRTRAILWISVTLWVLSTGCARSDLDPFDASSIDSREPAPGGGPIATDNLTADQMLESLFGNYARMESFHVDVIETMSLDRAGTGEISSDRTVATLARPNRLSLPGGDTSSVSLHADGERMWAVLGDRYSQDPCPQTMALIVDDPTWMPLLQQSSLFLLKLFSEDGRAALTRDVVSTAMLDDGLLEGRRMHRLQFTQPDFDWEMWVAADAPGLVHQVVVDMTKQIGVGLTGDDAARITNTIRFKNWRIDPHLDEAAFVYFPTSAAQRVDHVLGVSRQR